MLGFVWFTALYFVYCVVFFSLIQKPAFGIYNRGVNKEKATGYNVWQVYSHGLISDMIIAAYLSALPLIITAIHTMAPCFNIGIVLTVYNVVISVCIALISVSDTLLYRFWNYKLDSSAFVYLKSLKGTFASVSTGYIIAAFTLVILCGFIFFAGSEALTLKCSATLLDGDWPGLWKGILVFIVMLLGAGGLFLIIRGLKIRPNNPSVVYYSKNPFYNHWALNPAYSLIYSLGTRDEFKGKFRFYDSEECDRIFNPLFPTAGKTKRQLLRTERPNILLVIWESLGAEFVPSLGGRQDVAVNVDRIAKDGIMFTNCTAGSFRTDRGLVCLLSGYLGQPTTSVIRYTRKLPNLPALPRRMKEEGYVTTAIHGGDLTIMHKSDFYLASGHDRLISQKDIPSSAPTCKWGVQDGYMFDYIFDDIMEKTRRNERWFTTFQTLSSHEPFTVPYDRLPDDEVANSFAYVDHCFGRFVDRLKETPAWDDLLIICVADHGYNATHNPKSRSEYAHIPLLMAGGALKETGTIDTLMSQTDLAATLLGQMNMEHDEFIFSRDVLADSYVERFSFHTYNNGFMLTDDRGVTIVDNVSNEAIEGPDEQRESRGRAILQKLYEDLSKR
ncbi:MAG: sulfatase-like hydrolase/transferase [Staphylococcus sp.]|nr:sulfatase-like hydrolase/transferase [Staphylococcus sp.]